MWASREKGSREALQWGAGTPATAAAATNKEKRPPLKRGQLKLWIVRIMLGSLMAPVAKNKCFAFGR
jgi:hypothetical protein